MFISVDIDLTMKFLSLCFLSPSVLQSPTTKHRREGPGQMAASQTRRPPSMPQPPGQRSVELGHL